MGHKPALAARVTRPRQQTGGQGTASDVIDLGTDLDDCITEDFWSQSETAVSGSPQTGPRTGAQRQPWRQLGGSASQHRGTLCRIDQRAVTPSDQRPDAHAGRGHYQIVDISV